jgi:DNA polymerase elongation subunit (family B)
MASAIVNKFHGKIIDFPRATAKDLAAGTDPLDAFREQLPQRTDFIVNQVDAILGGDDDEPLLFLPNDVHDIHYRRKKIIETIDEDGHVTRVKSATQNELVYGLLMIGILRDGNKASVVITGVQPYVDLMIPPETEARAFLSWIRDCLRRQKIYPARSEFVDAYPFKYFNEKTSPYLRLFFNTSAARRKCINYCTSGIIDDLSLSTELRQSITTASDDAGGYYLKLSRERGFKLCDWNLIRKYDRVFDDRYTLPDRVPYCFEVDVADFIWARDAGIDMQADPIRYREYLRDRSIEMCWDIETSSYSGTGGVPLPENVFKMTFDAKTGATKHIAQDVIFMDSCVFCWSNDRDPFLVVNFTDIPTPARNDCLIVRCQNQVEIIKAKAILAGRMCPEFMVDFNGGIYDWPFIIRRAEQYDILRYGEPTLIPFLKQELSSVPCTEDNMKWMIRGPRVENIKLEAGINIKNESFNAPGFICVDTRSIFRQMFPTAEQSSLNFFLRMCKLELKNDMTAITMFKVAAVLKALNQYYATNNDFDQIMSRLRAEPTDRLLLRDILSARKCVGAITQIRACPFGLIKLTVAELIELADMSTLIVDYCNVDSLRCHHLLRARNVIADRREIANISYVSLYDAFYRAGGMKVRNLCISEAIKPEWALACSNRGGGRKDERKYPGGYVMYPKKGLYRDHRALKDSRVNLGDDRSKNNDIGPHSDRPCAGLDFSSLYPSLIMTYNISPEKIITDPDLVARLTGTLDRWGHPYRFSEIQFTYGLKDEAESAKEIVRGWVVQHTPIEEVNPKTGRKEIVRYDGMGVYPTVLRKLYDKRTEIKKSMEYYTGPKEFLDKLIGKHKAAALDAMTVAEQQALIRSTLAEQLAAAQRDLDLHKKPYYQNKVRAVEEVQHFFRAEWFERGSAAKNTCIADSITGLFEEIVFFFNYYNTKQLGVKVFMNTIYGESGNSISSFFIKHVAGKITTSGQQNIKMVKAFVESRGCNVLYSDTDSLYVTAPETSFAEVDAKYESGAIDKKSYWTAMIEITMEYLDQLKGAVNDVLYRDNGTRFLKMDYEECLWPYALVGKKKYIGIQHQGIVNLEACMPDTTLDAFTTSKSLFIRGLEVKKRGSSAFLKKVCFEIVKEAFCISSTKTLREIVESKLPEIATMQTTPEMNKLFQKSARYRLPSQDLETGKMKPGNVTVLRFVQRMRDLENSHPEIGIRAPEVGERFDYIVARCYPWRFDVRGRKIPIKVGDKYEYLESVNNADYTTIRGEPIEVDIDYYIMNEITGQFARFLTYHPEYDKFYEELTQATNPQSDLELENMYKAADKKAHDFAKKQLCALYKNNYARQYVAKNKEYQSDYRAVNKMFLTHIEENYGDAYDLFKTLSTVATNFEVTINDRGQAVYATTKARAAIEEKLIESAKKLGVKLANPDFDEEFGPSASRNPNQLYKNFLSGGEAILTRRRREANIAILTSTRALRKQLPLFERICARNTKLLTEIITKIRRGGGLPDEVAIPEMSDRARRVIDEVNQSYQNIIDAHITLEESKIIEREIKYLREAQHKGANPLPPGFSIKRTTEDLVNWMRDRRG